MNDDQKLVLATIDRLAHFFFIARTYGNALHKSRGITTGQRAIMMEIARAGEGSVVEMAERRGITKQAIQKTVDALAERGFLTKTVSPSDRRNRILHLTPTGRAILQDMADAEMAELGIVSGMVAPGQVIEVNRFLDLIEPEMHRRTVALSEAAR